jgi:hypothetical protein
MILPDKYIPQNETILGLGAKMLSLLSGRYNACSVNYLLNEMLKYKELATYERFVLTLDFLYMLGLIEVENGVIRRCS